MRHFLLFGDVTVAAWAIWDTLTDSLPPEQRAVLLLFLVAGRLLIGLIGPALIITWVLLIVWLIR